MHAFYRDISHTVQALCRFLAFVQYKDRQLGRDSELISFSDSSGFLGAEEGYKACIAEKAKAGLRPRDWREAWIGTGKIAECASDAVSEADNLVNIHQQLKFKDALNAKARRTDAERVLFDIYHGSDDKRAFEAACNVFGAKYDLIAFLFFIKDSERFLPVSPVGFDRGFGRLGIDLKTAYRCSWDNYNEFISIIRDMQRLINYNLPLSSPARLIDAHSFVWIVSGEAFWEWEPSAEESRRLEDAAEQLLRQIVSGGSRKAERRTSVYVRNAAVADEARKRAGGVCQLCRKPAPFNDAGGEPYLECHHIIWLSDGGEDSAGNTVALCPNCHRKMHVVNDENDVAALLGSLK